MGTKRLAAEHELGELWGIAELSEGGIVHDTLPVVEAFCHGAAEEVDGAVVEVFGGKDLGEGVVAAEADAA